MDFRFDTDERDIIEQAGLTLRRHLSAERLLSRKATVDGWRAVAEDGWLHAGLPEDEGGADLPLPMVAAIGREAGRVLGGDAYVNNAVLIPGLLGMAGEPALGASDGFLLADGRSEFLLGKGEGPTPWCFGAEIGFSPYCLTEEGRLLRYPADSWSIESPGRLGLATGTVTITSDAEPDLEVQIGPVESELLHAAMIVHSAGLIGLGEAAMHDTVEYVRQREQFGGPIGRFQAVKHGLAEVAVQLEVAWNATLFASLQPDETSVAIAHLQAAAGADIATRAMVQFFGGIAMTWEHHSHLYVKTAQLSRWRFGSCKTHALRLAGDLNEEFAIR